jgi:hypothetical protein
MRFKDSSDARGCGVPYDYCAVHEANRDMRATGVEAETCCVAKVEGCCQCFRIVLGEGVEEFGVHGSKRLTIVSPFLQSFRDGCGTRMQGAGASLRNDWRALYPEISNYST